MVSNILTVSFVGLTAEKVEVQVHIADGLPAFSIVGLANKSVAESKERIRAAFASVGLSLPSKRIIINLAPADLIKEGSHYDLPIALGLLIEMQILDQEELISYLAIGELSLNGVINKVSGVLPTAIWTNIQGLGLICPFKNANEAFFSGNPEILVADTLIELVNHFTGREMIKKSCFDELPLFVRQKNKHGDLRDVKGQKIAKRALEIAAAGQHNLLMIGPPGSGKSMLAKRILSITSEMTKEEILEASTIASLSGILEQDSLITERPFRAPHSSASLPAMIGGGKNAKPGEITLTHLGVLFLDELPEFQKNVLESLRQPLEDRSVTISRVNGHVSYPANFHLIAAMNPCKCGYFGDERLQCKRVPQCSLDYKNRISGPLLDRFDIQIEVSEIKISELEDHEESESSEQVYGRVLKAREVQKKRYQGLDIKTNAELEGEKIVQYISLDNESKDVLYQAVNRFKLSMRGMNKVLKMARTIADLENQEKVTHIHIKEALSYRVRDFI